MEIALVRRFVDALFAVFLAVCSIAADAPSSVLGTPTVVVYPFSATASDLDREAGSRLAIAIATQMANLGGVIVKPAPPGTARADYLSAAQHIGADYYVAGYLTPLGDGASLVEQLVSTQTGIVVFSNTAQIRTYADVTDQGDVLRTALLRHQTRNLGAYAAPPTPAASPTPSPVAGSGKQANLGQLFGRKQRRGARVAVEPTASPSAAPAPSPPPSASPAPSPSPSASPPPRAVAARPRAIGFGVLEIGGSAPSDHRDFTAQAIRNDMLARRQRVASLGGSAQTACSAAAVGTLLGGNLSTREQTILGQHLRVATLEFLAYDCAGNVVYRRLFARDTHGDWQTAIDKVVSAAVTSFLHDPVSRG